MTEWMIGVGIFIAGQFVGWVLGRRDRRSRSSVEEPKTICGCKHHWSSHDEGGTCHARVEEPIEYNVYGNPIAFKLKSCTCQRYAGPEPLPRYAAGQIIG